MLRAFQILAASFPYSQANLQFDKLFTLQLSIFNQTFGIPLPLLPRISCTVWFFELPVVSSPAFY